jgi:S-formylglutathione hydrolase FrmB
VPQLSHSAGPPGASGFAGHGVSLLTGWLPLTVQIAAGLVLLAAIARRDRRWLRWRLPALAVSGAAAVLLCRYYVSANGLASDPAPVALWIWVGLTAAAVLGAALGWRGAGWARRGTTVLAVPLSLLCVGVVLNDWVGYFPTVTEAWSQLTAGQLPDQVDAAQLTALAGTGASMRTGRLVAVTIPATDSHFSHRTEYVYLPPAWFDSGRPPLPALMMISGEFNTPADWIRVGNAVQTADSFAAQHGGVAPVLVFVDSGGSFNNDTECVDGPRGNVAEYLTKDVPGYLESQFRVAPAPGRWGIVGWSAGGTCAVDLAVMHPELFGTFVDIAGDLGPNVGSKATTVAKLYGGNAGAWSAFDPLTVLAGHPRYTDTAGRFDNAADPPPGGGSGGGRAHRGAGGGGGGPGGGGPGGGGAGHRGGAGRGGPGNFANRAGGTAGYGGRPDGGDRPGQEAAAASQLCTAASAKGIDCTLHTQAGRHSWQFASTAFGDALPWLASRVGLTGPPGTPAPGTPAPGTPAPGAGAQHPPPGPGALASVAPAR